LIRAGGVEQCGERMAVLITGGAGYIGSHMTHALRDRGERPIVLDNFSTGIRGLVPRDVELIEGNAGDQNLVRDLLKRHAVDSVVHFAGSIVVPDSVADPLGYYANNTVASRSLIEASVASGVKHFIFSSTATVYSERAKQPLNEDDLKEPISPYARSKLMTEWILEDAARAHGFAFAALRYFNVAGADPAGRTGQSTPKATHLIKRACQVALGRVPHLDIFGTDYPTPDGTGVRDYIHVTDLVDAHLLALDHLRAGKPSLVANCGYGHGSSVRDIVAVVERVTGRALPKREAPRRAGDPATLIADPDKLRSTLNWQPRFDDLDTIVAHAYEWERRLNA
jgi:UDP-glucose 4-epimerase